MYLSKFFSDCASVGSLHRLVMRGFPDGKDRAECAALYRVEPDGAVLVQSAVRPDWSAVLPAGAVQTRQFEITPADGIFRIAINPIAVRQRRRIPVSAADWLTARAERLGARFDIKSVDYATVHDYSVQSGRQHHITTEVATVTGLIQVVDADALAAAMRSGIGRARAYGCGLLSIVPTHRAIDRAER